MVNKNKELDAFPEGYNLVGKVVILYPSFSKDGIPFVFEVSGGSGARDGNIGTGVIGMFLIDGEEAKISAGNIMRLATEQEIKDKEVSLLTLGRMFKESELESEIFNYSYQILKVTYEEGLKLRHAIKKVEDLEDSNKSDKERLKELKEYYEMIDPYS